MVNPTEDETEKDSRRQMKSGATAIVLGVAAVLVAIMANVAFSQVFWRYDMTSDKIYTLSPASISAVSELEEPVEVLAFISPNMPPPFHNLSQQVDELLTEYQAASGGMLSYRIITPADDEEIEELARGYGVEKVAIGQQTDSSVSYRAVYKGVAFVQADRTEVVPDLSSSGRGRVDNFEYEFSRALLNLERSEPRRVAFLTGAGGPAAQPQFVDIVAPYFQQIYGELFEIGTVDLRVQTEIPEEYDALVVLNIDSDLGEEALFAIDQFIQRGGNLGWFQSGAVMDHERQQEFFEEMQARGLRQQVPQFRRPFSSDFSELMKTLGIHLQSDVVLDRERALASGTVMTEAGPARVSHPGTFSITELNPELPFLRQFSMLALPVPSTITFGEAAGRPEVEAFEVLRTAETSRRRPQPPVLPSYEELSRMDRSEEPGPFVVAVALQGRVASYYEDQPLPRGRTEADLVAEPQESRILVVGSGDFLGEYPDAGYHGNISAMGMEFFFSSVEWLAQEGDLGEIRGKNMPRFIVDVPQDVRRSIQFINIAVVPTLFLAIGSLMLVRRRKRKEGLDKFEFQESGTENGSE